MFLWDWATWLLRSLGLSGKRGKLLLLGLDNAGKTTLLHMLKHNSLATPVPTLHPSKQEMTVGDVTFGVYDLGGHAQARRVWADYCQAVNAIVFVVDAVDAARISEAMDELNGLRRSVDCPIAILWNKIDLPGAAGPEAIAQHLDLGENPRIRLFPTSIVRRTGYGDALRWLGTQF